MNTETSHKEELHSWVKQQYATEKLKELKKQHDAVWEAAKSALKEDLKATCNYLIKQQEKTKTAKVYITYALQCQGTVLVGSEQFPCSYDAFEGKTEEYDTFEEAWADFEHFVKHRYIQVTPSKEWEALVSDTFDPQSHGNGKFPFMSKMPAWFYDNKDYKYDCYLEYETHILGVN